jgi:hypothetical protein
MTPNQGDRATRRERVRALSEAILEYLTDHPDAADTVIGIRQWWLAGRFANASESDIRDTLTCLVTSGKMKSARFADGTEVYWRARQPPPKTYDE